ncbi:FliH/SctL family protein [Paraburkholderia sediminicola]|uniref:FliH/SctL family protein n=1 Tax=Paraburkholderia sediminicola TaxID=458836 RepID=UPI0038BB4AC9
MKSLGLRIINLPTAERAHKIMSALEFESLVDAGQLESKARARAAAALWKSRKDRTRRVLLEEQKLACSLAMERKRFEANLSREREQAIDDAVNWLVQEWALEEKVIREIEGVVRSLVASALEQLFGSEEQAQTLAACVMKELPAALEQGRVQIKVNTTDLRFIEQAVGCAVALDIVADSDIRPGQAIIDTPYVQLRVNVGDQLRRILESLRGAKRVDEFIGELQ